MDGTHELFASFANFCFDAFLPIMFLVMVQATERARRSTAVEAFAVLPILVLPVFVSFDGEKDDAGFYLLDAFVLFVAAEIVLFARLCGAGSSIAQAVVAGAVVASHSVKFLAAAVLFYSGSISEAEGRASFYLDAFVLFLVCVTLLFIRIWAADSPSGRAQVAPVVTVKTVVALLLVKYYAAAVLVACYSSSKE